MVGAALQSPDPEAAFGQLAASARLTGANLPGELASINEVLDALPDDLCNVFLVNYFVSYRWGKKRFFLHQSIARHD